MPTEPSPALLLVRQYLAALQAGGAGDGLAQFFTSDAGQVELPNALNPKGQTSDLPTILSRSLQGLRVQSSHTCETMREIAVSRAVTAVAKWPNVLRTP